MRLLPICLNTTHSECKPSFPVPTRTSHPCHHHIPAGRHPIISTLTLHIPNHLNLTRLTTSSTLCTPKRLYKSTPRFLSFSDTPHIHLTIIRSVTSVLSRLCRFATFIAQVSVPYVNALWTQALYIFPFMRYDAPRAVRIGDNSLNLAQAQLTLALAASSAPHPAPSVSPK